MIAADTVATGNSLGVGHSPKTRLNVMSLLRSFCVLGLAWAFSAIAFQSLLAQQVNFYGYDDCIRLSNASTEVILCPAAGGRILRYALQGKNILYLPAGDEGWTWDGKSTGGAPMNAGRCDIGPEQVVPPRPLLWQGRWTGEIISDRQAVMRSQDDPSTGVRLERIFELDAQSSKLSFTQRIINVSSETAEYCHWSRTFVNGKGTCLIPMSGSEAPTRFPHGYVRYDPPGSLVNLRPEDPHITRQGDYLIIRDHPLNPKLGFDSYRGWLAYISPQDLLFIKMFPTYPDRVYNEAAGLTISVWYPEREMVELEPIGPRERLQPGGSSEFTETWYLFEESFADAERLMPQAIAQRVAVTHRQVNRLWRIP